MSISAADKRKLRQLEESLWRRETRFDPKYMERVLTPDFFEFGRSGRIYKREDTLSHPDEAIEAELPLKNFEIHEINTNVALVTYVSRVMYEELEIGNRSSIWVKGSTGWRMRFHQGTPVSSK